MNLANSKIRYLFLIGIFVLGVLLCKYKLDNKLVDSQILLPVPITRQDFVKSISSTEATVSEEKVSENLNDYSFNQDNDLPESINLDVPFVVQAPFANWYLPYKEACEEASLLMVVGYLEGKKIFSQDQIKKEIDDLVSYQENKYGIHKDLNLFETGELAKNYWQLSYRIISDLDIDKIKLELSEGNPVIIPAAGRLLGNPNFRGEGPLYHMLVIKGYQDDFFITNDPGTRNGKDYLYSSDKLISAVADWSGKEPTGPKVGLILTK